MRFLILLLLIISCKTQDVSTEGVKTKDYLLCIPLVDGSAGWMYRFTSTTEYQYIYGGYNSQDCDEKTIMYKEVTYAKFTYDPELEELTEMGYKKEITYYEQPDIDYQNTNNVCGFSNWTAGVTKNITDLDCEGNTFTASTFVHTGMNIQDVAIFTNPYVYLRLD